MKKKNILIRPGSYCWRVISLVGLFILWAFIGAGVLQAATLTAGSDSGLPGENVSIPINLASEVTESVAGLSFDLNFDSIQLTVNNAVIGQAATDAGKSLSYSQPAAGVLRIIVFGLNQTTIADGVIADVSFNIQAAASAGTVTLSFSNATATDPDAQSVPLTTINGSITIGAGVNNPPVLDPIGDKSVDENQYLGFTVSASDPDFDTVTITASALESWMSFDGSLFSASPGYEDSGAYSITFTASDCSLTDLETIILTVANVNTAPVLNFIADITVDEGQIVSFSPTATDPEGDALIFNYSGWMASASYTTDYNDAGTYTVTVTVSDGSLTDSQDVIVTVNNINQSPEITSGPTATPATINED